MSVPRPARVAQIVRPAAGGIRRHVSLLAAGLDRTRYTPILYAPADFTLETPCADVPHHHVNIAPRTNPIADIRAILHLVRLLRGNADIVHAHGLRAALISVPAAKRARIPSLFTAHNLLPPLGRLQRILLRQVGHTANGILAVSQAVADTLIRAGLPASKIHVIPNGIPIAHYQMQDAPAWKALSLVPEGANVVLAIGRLSPEKGFDVLLNAFPTVVERVTNAHLVLVGDGPEAERLRTQAQSLPSAAHIHFMGRIQDVVPLLHLANVVTIPSRQEGQGIVALEAMAAGKPVVASAVGGLIETVVEGVTGCLVPPDDPAALAYALTRLLRNKIQEGTEQESAEAAAMRRHAVQRVEQFYTVERMIHNIENIYQSLLP